MVSMVFLWLIAGFVFLFKENNLGLCCLGSFRDYLARPLKQILLHHEFYHDFY